MFLLAGLFYVAQRYLLVTYIETPKLSFLNFSYTANFVATFLIISLLFGMRHVAKDSLGFMYMVLGVLKVIFFLVLAKTSGYSLGKPIFFHFFIPYVWGTLIEVLFLIQLLRLPNTNNINDLDKS